MFYHSKSNKLTLKSLTEINQRYFFLCRFQNDKSHKTEIRDHTKCSSFENMCIDL